MLFGQMIFGETEQIPFDFETNEGLHSTFFKPRDLVAQQPARREVEWIA